MLSNDNEFPNFTLTNQYGEKRDLKDYSSQWLVIFFYSKDNTSGCTKESTDFNEQAQEFAKLGAKIIGISGDSVKTHYNFSQKLSLTYEIFSDPGRAFIDSIGLLKDKKMYGKPVKGVNRSTFIIDPKGVIKASWSNVKVPGHVEEVLSTFKNLTKE